MHSVRKLWIVNGVLALPTGYWSCFLAYALYHRERLLWCETTILVHFVAPASILLLLLLSFKSRPILRAKLALSATVAMFVLFLADASLPKRGSSVGPARVEAALDRGLPYDTRSTLEVILALRAQGKRAVPVVSPATFTYKRSRQGVKEPFVTVDGRQVVPMAGVSDALTIYCNEGGQFLAYESDEHGFNNPKGLYQVGQVDIAALGDSFTHGACVASDDNAMAVIRNAYPRSINFGMSSNGPLFILATLRSRGEINGSRVESAGHFP